MSEITLGILGLGHYSTQHYVGKLNDLYNELNEEYSTCPFVMVNSDFQEINPFLPRTFDKLEEPIKRYISFLKKMNVDRILLPDIILHEAIDHFYEETSIFIHPLRESSKKLNLDGVKRCFAFGMCHIVASDYNSGYMADKGIEIMPLDAEDVIWIDRLRTKIFAAKHTEKEIKTYRWMIEKYLKIAPILISCTELSALGIKEKGIYDMVQIQIDQAIKFLN